MAAAPRTLAFLRRLTGSDLDSDDAWQECCARALRSRSSFDPQRGAFDSWIMRIAFHSYLDQRAAQQRAPQLLGGEDATIGGARFDVPATEEREELEALLRRLKPIEREVLLRFHRDEASVEEIARQLAMPAGTVKSHLHRARARLRTAKRSR